MPSAQTLPAVVAACFVSLAGAGGAAEAIEPKEVFRKAAPSVVVVQTQAPAGKSALGSGVAVRPHFVATNCHVVQGATRIEVRNRRERASAVLAFEYPETDVCLLRVEGLTLSPAAVSERRDFQPGERVYSIGAPRGLELTLSEGLISGVHPTRSGRLLQTSAPISPGSSGGGLFDETGALIGLTTMTLKDSQNLNFAAPASAVLNLLARLDKASPHLFAFTTEIALQGTIRGGATPAPQESPVPVFRDPEQRLDFLIWQAELGRQLASTIPDFKTRDELLQTSWYESKRQGLEPALVLGVIEVMSEFQWHATAFGGSSGYMGVHPSWWVEKGSAEQRHQLFHMPLNLRLGTLLLRHYLETNRGDTYAALIDYYRQATGGVRGTLSSPQAVEFAEAVFKAQHRWTYPPR
jgi:hypothetical protein